MTIKEFIETYNTVKKPIMLNDIFQRLTMQKSITIDNENYQLTESELNDLESVYKLMKRQQWEFVQDLDHLALGTPESVLNILETNKHIKEWHYILHDKDHKLDVSGELKKPHIHVMINFDNSYTAQYVANMFKERPSQISTIKTTWNNALAYLCHRTPSAKHKYQYDYDEIISSNHKAYLESVKKIKKIVIEDVINDICNGKVSEYNLYHDNIQGITNELLINNYSKIQNAFKIATKKKLVSNTPRNIKVIYCQGEAGDGKTTYARLWAEKQKLSYTITSDDNDPLQDYMGEDVLIFDEMRGSCMKLSGLLKLLDNNTRSSIKSRYINKFLDCKYIILTSTKTINELYEAALEHDNESKIQLYRRTEYILNFEKEIIHMFKYNKEMKTHEYQNTITNPVPEYVRSLPSEEQIKITDFSFDGKIYEVPELIDKPFDYNHLIKTESSQTEEDNENEHILEYNQQLMKILIDEILSGNYDNEIKEILHQWVNPTSPQFYEYSFSKKIYDSDMSVIYCNLTDYQFRELITKTKYAKDIEKYYTLKNQLEKKGFTHQNDYYNFIQQAESNREKKGYEKIERHYSLEEIEQAKEFYNQYANGRVEYYHEIGYHVIMYNKYK